MRPDNAASTATSTDDADNQKEFSFNDIRDILQYTFGSTALCSVLSRFREEADRRKRGVTVITTTMAVYRSLRTTDIAAADIIVVDGRLVKNRFGGCQ